MTELYAGKSLAEEPVQEILVDKPADEPGEQSRCSGKPAPDDLFYVYLVWVGHELHFFSLLKYCLWNNEPRKAVNAEKSAWIIQIDRKIFF